MRKSLIITFFVLIVFSSLCFGKEAERRRCNLQSDLMTSKFGENEFPNIFRSTKDLFRRIFGKKRKPIVCYVASITNVTLSAPEITMTCLTNNACLTESQKVFISTEVQNFNADVVSYAYTVSAGKIVGLNGEEISVPLMEIPNSYHITKVKQLSDGAKVIWDLSGVKPGTYTITAAVDDGCGFCGLTKTKTIIIKECPDCQNK